MGDATVSGPARLIELLDRSVRAETAEQKTERVKGVLTELYRNGARRLPERFYQPHPQRYARRLLHRSEALGYTAVVMTWGPGQRTELHDHAGMWCVETVLMGSMEITRYDLVDRDEDLCRFEQKEPVRAEVGSAGSLIPPYEYHVLANALSDRLSVTLHVYGGEMDHCCTYRPMRNGWHQRMPRVLHYDE